MVNRIVGSGGGKGGGGGASRTPIEAPDSLRSKAFARVLDVIGEGEIEGLVDGAKSIYLDETPLQNADGSFNFKDVVLATVNGTQAQAYIPGFPAVENTVQVGVEVTQAASVTRQFTNGNLDAVVVTIGVPGLSSQSATTGDISGTSVGIAIDVQSNGGGFVRQDLSGRGTITGKTSSRYQRSFRVTLSGNPPWDVRVVRLTADSASQTLNNKTFWDTYTEVIDAKLRYPNSALVGLKVDAAQFTSIPRRAYDAKLLRVRVPTNYNPLTRVYTGSWDGNFQIAWTDNPAWCFFDLLTNERYGLGEFVDLLQVDKWAIYSIGRYCDELVPDGKGGQEPRFTCNIYLQSRAEAYKVMSDMASIFRGMAFWASGSVTAVQDAPADPAYLYAPANVVDGQFTYAGSSAKARHTVALVTWNDPDDFHRQKVEYVEDAQGIARYGVITTEIAAVGCSSQGQAHRAGRWLLYSERLESETVTFRVGIEGAIARPGQVIKVADPARAGVRFGGRIQAATTTSVTLDAAVTLVSGQAYTLSCLKADGTVQESTVTTAAGTASVLTVSPAFAEAPQVNAIWLLASTAVEAQTFRVVAVAENERHEFEITALAHDPEKFAAVEQNLVLEPRSISVLSDRPATPTNLAVTESLYQSAQGVRVRMAVSWSPVPSASSYVVTYQPEFGNVSSELVTNAPAVDILDVVEGIYTVRVASVNALGRRSVIAGEITYQVLGKTAPPENVQNFTVARNGDVLNFVWRHVGDLDIDHYELRLGETWNTAFPIGATAANAFSVSSPRGGTFLLKAVDTSDNFSASEAVVVAPDISGINVVEIYDDYVAGFPGTFVDTVKTGIDAPVTWSDPDTWDSMGPWDSTQFVGGVTLCEGEAWSTYTEPWASYTEPWLFLDPISSGTYTTQSIDIGFKATSTVAIESRVDIISVQPPWSAFTEPWSYYAAPEWSWQGKISGIAATYEVRTSDNNITWSPWQAFTPGAYTFRYLQVRVTLTTDDLSILPYMTKLIVKVDVPDRVLHFEDVAIPLAGATLSFSPQFVDVPTVQVTLQSAVSGDRFTVTGKTTSGVTIQVFDSAGAAKTGVVDVDVFGYGERF